MNDNLLYKWHQYFEDIGLRSDLARSYMPYIRRCISSGVPPIFESSHLALLVGRHPADLSAMGYGTKSYYRRFKIKKRTGGSREIQAPYPSLLEVQRWIVDEVLSSVNLPVCVTGYREGVSIFDNALVHCGRKELLKIDLKDFFPSIGFSRVVKVFIDFGYSSNVAFLLAKLCTLDRKLPQGAASSPYLSNIICRDLDQRFMKICKSKRLRYTRYADDIVISGKSIPKGIRRLFFEIIASEGFQVNEKKVRFLSEGDKKIVTGLDITSGKPRPTRRFRRDLKRDVYFVWSSGLSSHVARRRIFFPNYFEQLEGRVRFWEQIEPENVQMKKTMERVVELRSLYGRHR
ncbi:MAG: RNA-directed DNA polymerase [Shimia sp.]|uniref:reverse transcriptase family protein n=1 Tax=Shimia sp. TaxID=1954381 RepID=UPI003B8E3051